MQREILFRGKNPRVMDDGIIWVYGSYAKHDGGGGEMIIENTTGYLEADVQDIIPETIGQFIGELDKNGTKIFEGDVVKFNKGTGEIIFKDGEFQVTQITGINEMYVGSFYCIDGKRFEWRELEVIGNRHDNPELLKV